MARLVKMEYINDVNVYKCELSEEMLELWKEDQDAFWEKYGDEVEEMLEFSHDDVSDPSEEYLIEED
jgi:hypothetical protein